MPPPKERVETTPNQRREKKAAKQKKQKSHENTIVGEPEAMEVEAEKQQVEPVTPVKRDFLGSFWDLASVDVKNRAAAASFIIQHLLKTITDSAHVRKSAQKENRTETQTAAEQNEVDDASESGEEVDEIDDDNDSETDGRGALDTLPQDLSYTIKRLVRGLASSRESARQGFAATLSEVLQKFPSVSLQAVMSFLLETTETTGSMKGVEEREKIFGRIFGCMALFRSTRLCREDEDSMKITQAVIEQLADLHGHKKWLREICAESIVSMLPEVPLAVAKETKDKLIHLLQGAKPKHYNAEQLQIAIALQRYAARHSDSELQEAFAEALQTSSSLLRSGKLQRYVECLRASSSVYPRVHSVWHQIMLEVLPAEGETSSTLLLEEFWNVVVCEGLIQSTHERKGLAFKLCELVLPKLQAKHIPIILNKPFLRCLMNNLTKKETYLHGAAKDLVNAIVKASKNTNGTHVAVAIALLTNGSYHFDKQTGTSAISTLVQEMGSQGLRQYMTFLMQSLMVPKVDVELAEEDEKTELSAKEAIANQKEMAELQKELVDGRRIWAIDSLYAATRNHRLPWNEELLEEILQFFLANAFFLPPSLENPVSVNPPQSAKKKSKKRPREETKEEGASGKLDPASIYLKASGGLRPDPPLSPAVTASAEQRFFGLVSDLSSGASAGRDYRARGDGETWIYTAHSLWHKWSQAGLSLRTEFPPQFRSVYDDVQQILSSIRSQLSKRKEAEGGSKKAKQTHTKARPDTLAREGQLRAFELVFSHVGLHLLSPGKVQETAELLEELQQCYQDILIASDKKNKKTPQKPKKKSKKEDTDSEDDEDDEVDPITVLVEVLISLLAQPSHMLREVVKQVFRSVCSMVNEDALDAILQLACDPTGSSDSVGVVEEDEEEDDDEFAPISPEELERIRAKAAAEAEDDEEESGEEEDEITISLDAALRGENGVSDVDGLESDDDEDRMEMEDAAMAALLQASKQKKDQKKKAKTLAQQTVHFRLRVLDLLEIFLNRQSSSHLCVTKCLPAMLSSLAKYSPLFHQQQGGNDGKQAHGAMQQQQQQLHRDRSNIVQRLKAIYRNSLCKSKEVPAFADKHEFEEVVVKPVLDAVLEIAVHANNKEVVTLASQAVEYMVRVLSANKCVAENSITEFFATACDNFFTQKRTKLHPVIFEDLITRHPQLAWAVLAPRLARAAMPYQPSNNADATDGAARSIFARCEAFRLLTALLKQKKVQQSPDVIKMMKALGKPLNKVYLVALEELAQGDSQENNEPKEETGETASSGLHKGKRAREILLFGQMFVQAALKLKLIKIKDAPYEQLLKEIATNTKSGVVKGLCINTSKMLA